MGMKDPERHIDINKLMACSGVQFGTSGARGLVTAMTDEVCYSYTLAFLHHLRDTQQIQPHSAVAIAGDLRASTMRILNAVAAAISNSGYKVIHCGQIPAPALACYGFDHSIPSLMVTGSHIPDDRNGIKFNTPKGEILKTDEAGIRNQSVAIPAGLFTPQGTFTDSDYFIPDVSNNAYDQYLHRYLSFFPENCLHGTSLGLYQHSSVGRDIFFDVITRLGAEVIPLGFSDAFVSVDTEAIRDEDVTLAKQWATEGQYDAIISADGDADRPLISDEHGTWVRGDIAGILTARFLNAQVVVTPVSSNTAVEKSGLFKRVERTKIGSPFVIAAMLAAASTSEDSVVGYEANGGFLTATDITRGGMTLKALATRDAIIVPLCILMLCLEQHKPISKLVSELPNRFTASNRIKDFPSERSKARISTLIWGNRDQNIDAIEAIFHRYFGSVSQIDATDGVRITFSNGEIAHLRPSGNAPEFRCYNEADSPERAQEMNDICMNIISSWT